MAQDFNVEIKGLDELKRAFENYPTITEPIFQEGVLSAEAVLENNTKGEVGNRSLPVPARTTNLLHSFRKEEGRLWARWFPTAPYAADVHNGTGPHTIYPKNGKALAIPINGAQIRSSLSKGKRTMKVKSEKGWSNASVGENIIFRKSVHHPGTRANPFMPKILNLSKARIDAIFVRTLDTAIRELIRYK